MHRILVEEKRWIGEQRFLHALQLLHAAAGPGGAAARDLYRLAAAQDLGRHRRGHALRAAGRRRDVFLSLDLMPRSAMTIGFVAGMFFGIKPAVLAIVLQALVRASASAR